MASPGICSVDGCGKPLVVRSRGLCRAHYHKWYRYGDPASPHRRHPTWAGELCSIDGCERPVKGLGICDAHRAEQVRKRYPERQQLIEVRAKSRYLEKREALLGRPRPELCEICGCTPQARAKRPRNGMCFDHCHATGKPRGWICDRCNKVLGMVKDDTALLRKLADYLDKNAHGETNKQSTKSPSQEGLRGTG
jgi:hypothetical protein